MSIDLHELKRVIQSKLANLEREKADLQEKLAVVGQVENFAHELDGPGSAASQPQAQAQA